jgi:hypothetical protein
MKPEASNIRDEIATVGILVHGDNHFIVSGPLPGRETVVLQLPVGVRWAHKDLGGETVGAARSGGQFEELMDELNLTPNIRSAHPPNLPLPHHVHRLVTLDRSLRRLEFSEPLLGAHLAFDRAVVLLENVVQILYGSVQATAAKHPFLL